MFNLFLALFLAFACPAGSHTGSQKCGGSVVTTFDSGGDQGHLPPPPPPPPGGNG